MKRIQLILILTLLVGLEVSAQEYLALGDSYTIGERVLVSERWPNQLVEALKGSQIEVDSAKIIAKTGWTTAELNDGIKAKNNKIQYDLVSLLIGVNNQYRGQSIERFEQELIQLIDKAIRFSKQGHKNVFLVSIPDWGVTPFAKNNDRDGVQIGKEIEAYNAIVAKQAQEFDVPFIDITPISKRAKNDPSLLAEDQLHPSGKMYTLWVDQISK